MASNPKKTGFAHPSKYCCVTQSQSPHELESYVKEVNKSVKWATERICVLKFPILKSPIHFVVYSDAAFNNMPHGGSQGGGLVFVPDDDHNSALIGWRSKRIRRVVKSSFAAETMQLSESVDLALFCREIYCELLCIANEPLLICIIDSKDLYLSLNSNKGPEEKRLRLEISCLKESIDKENVKVLWKPGNEQHSDCLTKLGSNPTMLLEILQKGRLTYSE